MIFGGMLNAVLIVTFAQGDTAKGDGHMCTIDTMMFLLCNASVVIFADNV